MTTTTQPPDDRSEPAEEHLPEPPARLLDRVADALDEAGDLRFGHLVPLSARRPSVAYLQSREWRLPDDEELAGAGDGGPVGTPGGGPDDSDGTGGPAPGAASDGAPGGDASATPDAEAGRPAGGSHRRDALVTTVFGLAIYGLSLFTGPLLARSLGAADRGTYAAVWTPTQIVGWLLMLGIPAATTYFARAGNRRQLDTTAWVLTAAVGLPVVAVLWPLAPLFLHRHPPEAVFWFRAFLVAMLLVLPMQNTYEYCRARGQNIRFNVYRSLPLGLTTVFVVGLFVAGRLDLRNALFATFLANLLGAVAVIGAERTWPRPWGGGFDRRYFRLQVDWGLRVWVGTLSNMVLARFDQFLMVGIVAPEQLGLYAIAVTAAGVSAPVAQGVGFALFPYLLRDDDTASRDRRMWQGFRWVLLGSLAIGAALAAVVPWGLPALFGPAFRGSVAPFFVLLPGQVMWNLAQVFKTRLDADNRPGAGSNSLALAAMVTVVGVPAAVPQWGIMGAAAVTTISQTVFCVAGWWFVHRGPGGRTPTTTPAPAGKDAVAAAEVVDTAATVPGQGSGR